MAGIYALLGYTPYCIRFCGMTTFGLRRMDGVYNKTSVNTTHLYVQWWFGHRLRETRSSLAFIASLSLLCLKGSRSSDIPPGAEDRPDPTRPLVCFFFL